ncbi:metallophosphoesterase family protein [Metallosphaera sp.]
MSSLLMVSNLPCKEDVIERINEMRMQVVGLGDVECPQHIINFKGILGEMEGITARKYLETNNLIITKLLDLSSDFSTPFVIVHEPPYGVGTGKILNVNVGSRLTRSRILAYRPKVVFHGHSEVQREVYFNETKVISIGSGFLGQFVIYQGEGKYIYINLND